MANIFADEALAWDDLHSTHKADHVNHSVEYSTGDENLVMFCIRFLRLRSFFSTLTATLGGFALLESRFLHMVHRRRTPGFTVMSEIYCCAFPLAECSMICRVSMSPACGAKANCVRSSASSSDSTG